MQVAHLKWWHWVVAGVVLGALFGWTRVFAGPNLTADQTIHGDFERFIVYRKFERYRNNANSVADFLDDVVVHPPLDDQLRQTTEYAVQMQEDQRTTELEITPDGIVRASHILDADHPSVRRSVYWSDVAAGALPPEVSSAARTARPNAQLTSASTGPRVIIYWVTGTWWHVTASKTTHEYVPRRFLHEAPAPYTPDDHVDWLRHNAPGLDVNPAFDATKVKASYPTVMDYLALLKEKYNGQPALWPLPLAAAPTTQATTSVPPARVIYRYAWEESSAWVMARWTGLFAVLIGGLWPLYVRLLVMSGLAGIPMTKPRPQPAAPHPLADNQHFKRQREVRTERAQQRAQRAEQKKQRAMEKLAHLQAKMEAHLIAQEQAEPKPATPPPAPPAPGEVVVRQLSAKRLDPPEHRPRRRHRPTKDFGAGADDYYPTEVHVEKDPKKKQP